MAIIDNFNKSIEIAKALYDPYSTMRCQHFSIIMSKSRVVSIGKNSIKTSPINLLNFNRGKNKDILDWKGVCSELSAINKLRNLTNIRTKDCVLFNVRINRNNEVSFARPCNFCRNLIAYFPFKSVYYSNWNGQIEQYC